MASIVAGQTAAFVAGGHNFWILKDDNGAVVSQIHGWGYQNGKLQLNAATGDLVATTNDIVDLSGAYQQTVLQGSFTDLKNRWEAGKTCAEMITANEYSYNFLSLGSSFNSNNVYSTVGKCMGLDGPRVGNALFLPGLDEMILEQVVIEYVRERFGLSNVDDDDLPEPSVPQTPETIQMPVAIVGLQESTQL